MKNFYIFIFIFFILDLHAKSNYELGEGLQVDDLPAYVGGYVSTQYKYKNKTDDYSIDDLAFMSYGNYKKLSYMTEFEFRNLYTKHKDENSSVINYDKKLYAERVYVDYAVNDNYAVRLGKFNSPVGFWNLLPINVLQETISSPYSTQLIFPEFTSGLDLSYKSFHKGELKIDTILQNNTSLDNKYNNYDITQHYGIGISYERNAYALKFNGGYFRKTENKNFLGKDIEYALISGKYETDKFQILTEIGTQKSSVCYTTPYALYLQGAYHFTQKHTGVLRFESFEDELNKQYDSIGIIGYTYRPLYPVALKAEYQLHSLKDTNQVLLSFSVIF